MGDRRGPEMANVKWIGGSLNISTYKNKFIFINRIVKKYIYV